MIASDVIPLTMEIKLIRKHRLRKTLAADIEKPLSDLTERRDAVLSTETWSGYILKAFANLLRSHTLSIDFTQTSSVERGSDRCYLLTECRSANGLLLDKVHIDVAIKCCL